MSSSCCFPKRGHSIAPKEVIFTQLANGIILVTDLTTISRVGSVMLVCSTGKLWARVQIQTDPWVFRN